LEKNGYQADVCGDGSTGWDYAKLGVHDALLLDRMLPEIDGVALLRRVREAGLATPVLMITALDGIGQRVEGLDAGADDYLVKPFAVEEMLARVRALLRRPKAWESTMTAEAFGLQLDEEKNLLRSKTQVCSLSKRETGLLSVFMRNAGQTMPRGLLLSKVWGPDAPVEDGNLDNYIYFLRKRLKAVDAGAKIATVHGVGYRLEA
jgi:DNA-binding response OmpR family regulator